VSRPRISLSLLLTLCSCLAESCVHPARESRLNTMRFSRNDVLLQGPFTRFGSSSTKLPSPTTHGVRFTPVQYNTDTDVSQKSLSGLPKPWDASKKTSLDAGIYEAPPPRPLNEINHLPRFGLPGKSLGSEVRESLSQKGSPARSEVIELGGMKEHGVKTDSGEGK
jgi:hypothetical protein